MVYGQLLVDMPFFNRSILFSGLIAVICLVSACQNPAAQSSSVSTSDAQKINRLLVLMDQRLGIAPQVAKAKWNSGAPVDDLKRESTTLNEEITQNKLIGKEKCDLRLVKIFFHDQFNAGKIIQKDLLITWHKTYPANYKFDDAANLVQQIRPQLDKLTPELISAFCDVQTILLQPEARHHLFVQSERVVRDDADGAARRQSLMGFQTLGR